MLICAIAMGYNVIVAWLHSVAERHKLRAMNFIEVPVPRLRPEDAFYCIAVSESYSNSGRVKLYFEVWRRPSPDNPAAFICYIITEVQLAYTTNVQMQFF